jgi:hypothetical protein
MNSLNKEVIARVRIETRHTEINYQSIKINVNYNNEI